MIRKAIILAAASGMAASVRARPVPQDIVAHLAGHGIENIVVHASGSHDHVRRSFGDGRRFGVRIAYSFEGSQQGGRPPAGTLGSAGALRSIHDATGFIDGTTIVLGGDAVADLDIVAAARLHGWHGAVATVITRPVAGHAVGGHGIVSSRPDGTVAAFQDRPEPALALSRQASTGIYLLEPQVLELIPSDRTFEIGRDLLPALVRRRMRLFHQAHRLGRFAAADAGAGSHAGDAAMAAAWRGHPERTPSSARMALQ